MTFVWWTGDKNKIIIIRPVAPSFSQTTTPKKNVMRFTHSQLTKSDKRKELIHYDMKSVSFPFKFREKI